MNSDYPPIYEKLKAITVTLLQNKQHKRLKLSKIKTSYKQY